MSALLLAGAAAPLAATYLLLQPLRRAGVSRLCTIALTIGLGLGLSSCAFFVALLLFDGHRAGVIAIDTVLLLIGVLVWRRAGPDVVAPAPPWSTSERVLAFALLLAALAAALSFIANTLDLPHGRWDAWATWNLRARWLADAGPAWRDAFAKPTIHGDYPLLLPAAVARLWVYAGSNAPLVPALVAAAFAGALVLLLSAALAELRGRAQALVGALCLLGTPLFLRLAPWQYADLPLAFNLLAALALLAIYDRAPARGGAILLWAGVAAGLATWTKNEGLMLCAALVAVRAARSIVRREFDRRAAAAFVAGLLLPAAITLYFKVALAARSAQFGQKPAAMLEQLVDLERYATIVRSAADEFVRGTVPVLIGLLLYALLLGRARDRDARGLATSIGAMLAVAALGYGFTYVTTRAELTWLVSHSIDRIELQLWPAALLALLLYVGSPSEWVAAGRPVPRAERRRARG